MSWHYAIIRKTKRTPRRIRHDRKSIIIHYYDIHEVYLDDNGKVRSWTEEPVSVNGSESVRGLQWALNTMLGDALRYPVYEIRKGKLFERAGNDQKTKER